MMKETHVIQKVADAESALNTLLDDYNKILNEYKAQTSFAKKIKQAVLVKKIDATIYNILNTTSALIKYALLKNILSPDLVQHYNNLFKEKFNEYKNMRNSTFGTRKSKILEKRNKRASGQNKKASLQSVPVPPSAESAATPEAVF